jgi:hypothetical protein
MELENITLKEYFTHPERWLYNYVSKYSKKLNEPLDLFNIGSFDSLSFGAVKDAQHFFENGYNFIKLVEFVESVTNYKYKQLANFAFFDWCRVRRYIELQINAIIQAEAQLSYKYNEQDQNAGIENFIKFGVLIQIDKLAGGDILKYEAIRAQPYKVCFMKLLYDKQTEDFKENQHKQMLINAKIRNNRGA